MMVCPNGAEEFLSESAEDYLETIYEISLSGTGVHVVDVAERLECSKPSVTQAVRVLKERGFVTQEPYGTIELTARGRERGRRTLQRHHILRAFLIEQLGVDEQIADEEACKMEHTISQDTMDRWIAYLERDDEK